MPGVEALERQALHLVEGRAPGGDGQALLEAQTHDRRHGVAREQDAELRAEVAHRALGVAGQGDAAQREAAEVELVSVRDVRHARARSLGDRPRRIYQARVRGDAGGAMLRGEVLGLVPVSVLERGHHDLVEAIGAAHVVRMTVGEKNVEPPPAREPLGDGAHVADAQHGVDERRVLLAHHEVGQIAHRVGEAPEPGLYGLRADEVVHSPPPP